MHSNSQHHLPRAWAPLCFILFDVTKSLCHLLWAVISKLILRFVSKGVLWLGEHIWACSSSPLLALVSLDGQARNAHLPECDGVPRATACDGALPKEGRRCSSPHPGAGLYQPGGRGIFWEFICWESMSSYNTNSGATHTSSNYLQVGVLGNGPLDNGVLVLSSKMTISK